MRAAGRQGEGVGERDLARLVDEQVVERLGVLAAVVPGGAGGEPRRRIAERGVVVDGVDQAVLGVEPESGLSELFFRPLNSTPSLVGDLLDLVQQVVDHLVAGRGDADALPAPDQVDDQAGSGVGLARARRALDEEVAAVEGGDDLLQLVDLHPGVVDVGTGLAVGQARRVAAQEPAGGCVAIAGSGVPGPSITAAARRRSAPCCSGVE